MKLDIDTAADLLSQLGNPTRLRIVRELVRTGRTGMAVGEIQQKLGIPNSTLSHHISRLVSVGLIKQNRESRTLYCTAQYDSLRELIDFLQSECCAGVAECN